MEKHPRVGLTPPPLLGFLSLTSRPGRCSTRPYQASTRPQLCSPASPMRAWSKAGTEAWRRRNSQEGLGRSWQQAGK